MFKKWIKLFALVLEPEIDEAFLKNNYASMPFEQLKLLNPSQLTKEARVLWAAELETRKGAKEFVSRIG